MTRFALLSAALALQSAAAFAPAAPSKRGTALSLVPEQGRQLEAFSQQYLANKAKESASKASNLTSGRRPKGVAGAARSLVTRLLGDDGKERRHAEGEKNPLLRQDDEVLYPIVGFSLVDGHALPIPGQQATCDLHLHEKGEEDAYGYWARPRQGGDSLRM